MPPSKFANARKSIMATPKQLAEAARNALPKEIGITNIYEPDVLKANFDLAISSLLSIEYAIYQHEEEQTNKQLMKDFLIDDARASKPASPEQVIDFIAGNFGFFNEFFSSLAQSRKSRAGLSFEDHVRFLFRQLNYPFEEQKVINGKPDFLLPNAAMYKKNPTDLILFTLKRTFRERWRQVVPEGFRTPQYFLATIDESLSKSALDEMLGHRIILVMPAANKESIPVYNNALNVVSFSTFFNDYLDPVALRWRRAGIKW